MIAARIVVTAIIQRMGDKNISCYIVVSFVLRAPVAEEALPEGLLFWVSRPCRLGLDNSNLVIVIGCAQPEILLLQLRIATIYVDTSFSECKHLALSTISGLRSAHELYFGALTRPSTVK